MKNIIIIRHFKTCNERINYEESLIISDNFIKKIIEHMEYNNINDIIIYTSDTDRTIVTALILVVKLKDYNINVKFPQIENNLNRDPFHERIEITQNYFDNFKFDNNKLVIFITHSSVYEYLYKILLLKLSNKILKDNIFDLKKNNTRIFSYSMSYINLKNDKLKSKFNIDMREIN